MILPKKYFIGFLFYIFCISVGAQPVSKEIALEQVFVSIEKQFNCTFSYKDNDVSDHFVNPSSFSNLPDAIAFLQENTLFDYNTLQDLSVTVTKKKGLIARCVEFKNAPDTLLENVTLHTPYQKLLTGKDGKVRIEVLNTSEKVTATYMGYKSRTIPVSTIAEKNCTSIRMEQEVIGLGAVMISNFLVKGISKGIDGSFVVDYDDFSILPGLIEPDVLQTIQALPGIQSVNETVSNINIRGGTNDQNLILWDGIKMYQSGHFFGLISAFNPHLTDKVRVLKNGTSAMYGDGVSGIISMQGDSKLNKELDADVGINLISADAYIDTPIGKNASLQVSGRKSINSLFETPTYEAYFDKAFQNTEVLSNSEIQSTSDDDFSFYDTSLRLLYEPSQKDFIRANFMVLGNTLEFLENATVDNVSLSRKSDLDQSNISGGIFYEREWNSKFSTGLQIYGSSYNLKATNFDILNNQQLLQENRVLESGIKTEVNYRFSERIDSKFGYQLNETGITNFEQINNPFFEKTDKQVLLTNSLFSEIRFKTRNQKTIINFGLRGNHISKFDEILIEPRINFNHRFLDYFTVELAGEIKSQTTTQVIDLQNDFLGVESRRWVLSKPEEIPILKGRQVSIGINYTKNGFLISAEPYLKKVKGITTQSQGFQNQLENVKTHGSYFVKGIDVLVNKRLKNLNTWLSYSYAENTYSFETLSPKEFSNNLDIRHSVTFGINYDLKKFKLSMGLNWHSGKPTTSLIDGNEIANSELNYNIPNTENIDDYFRVDFSGTYSFNLGKKLKGFAGFSVWNLLDSSNVVNTFYRINHSDTLEQINENALRFTPNATFRVSF